MAKCERCDDQGTNCWVLMGVVTGAFYSHAKFVFVEVCPFCKGRKALEASDD